MSDVVPVMRCGTCNQDRAAERERDALRAVLKSIAERDDKRVREMLTRCKGGSGDE